MSLHLLSPLPLLFVGFEKNAEMLIERGADVNAVNKQNNSALMGAAVTGNYIPILVVK